MNLSPLPVPVFTHFYGFIAIVPEKIICFARVRIVPEAVRTFYFCKVLRILDAVRKHPLMPRVEDQDQIKETGPPDCSPFATKALEINKMYDINEKNVLNQTSAQQGVHSYGEITGCR